MQTVAKRELEQLYYEQTKQTIKKLLLDAKMKTLSNDERVNRQKTNEIIESYKHLIMETPNVENVIELKEKKIDSLITLKNYKLERRPTRKQKT